MPHLLHVYHLLRNLGSGMYLHLRRYQMGSLHPKQQLHPPRFVLWRSLPMFWLWTLLMTLSRSCTVLRAARLDLQWHQQQVAVVGLQESRRAAGRGQLDHYVTFASGADFSGQCPHHGCELWLHKSLPWTTLDEVGPVTFSDMHATVALSDPCRLVVNLQHHEMKISFVVLHAPCRSASPDGSLEAIQTW